MIEGCRLPFSIQPAPWCQEGFSFVLCLSVLLFTSETVFFVFFGRRLLWHRCGAISDFFLRCLDSLLVIVLLFVSSTRSSLSVEWKFFVSFRSSSTLAMVEKKHQRANVSFKYRFCIICLSSSPAKHTHKPSTQNAIFVFLIGHLRNSGPYINTTGG